MEGILSQNDEVLGKIKEAHAARMEYLGLKEKEVREVSDRVASANQTATEQENVAIKENLK